ncbi:MAG TPA: Atu4866 domain-containing protein [Vitreimonas sp.]|uniref:Atu4866 domain-containing protein n=1 Tax=Vitreimonas sp. TaxID=3069702 RepID=UPI002D70DA1B|nr:Atu4866 domain-containing protein [Vitreimonas sp.]HYD86685.1 Atu4866 domain-containing protein [Vitreimonas sp.]
MLVPKPTHTVVDGGDPGTFVGLWKSASGYFGRKLLPDGRFVEMRGERRNASEGNYRVEGARIAFENDAGGVIGGAFRDGALIYKGMTFYKVN